MNGNMQMCSDSHYFLLRYFVQSITLKYDAMLVFYIQSSVSFNFYFHIFDIIEIVVLKVMLGAIKIYLLMRP